MNVIVAVHMEDTKCHNIYVWQMVVTTGFYVNLTRSVALIHCKGDQSPICDSRWSPPQSFNKRWKSHRRLFRPYWVSSVWCIDGWCQIFLGRWSSFPLAMVQILLTWSGWHKIQWLLPFVLNSIHWVRCTNPNFANVHVCPPTSNALEYLVSNTTELCTTFQLLFVMPI